MRVVELLSPAKNCDVARSAINAGADAVYIGANSFSARQNAANDTAEIKSLCEYAHLFGVKVYVALNTLLKDGELSAAQTLIHDLYNAKVDAIIVQDMGILKMDLPEITLHASTQCDIDTPEKAKFLYEAGFDTIVLARELSLKKIEQIARAVPEAKIEVFVHGALCVSKSGKCYLSEAIGGRSANRGQCAQPCRMAYSLLDANGKKVAPDAYYLSLKDMNRSAFLGELIDSGVSSFKIEGRLKDADYVKNTTSYYNDLLCEMEKQGLAKRQSFGKVVKKPFAGDVNKVFNRGFTDFGLVEGAPKNFASMQSPKSRGEYLGKITRLCGKNAFYLNNLKIENGDGFFALSPDNVAYGFRVEKVENGIAKCSAQSALVPQSRIWRNSSAACDRLFGKEFARRLSCKMFAKCNGDFFEILLECENGISASFKVKIEEFANNFSAACERVKASFLKGGEYPFLVEDFAFEGGKIPFFKASQINEIRRSVFAELKNNILQSYNAQYAAKKRRRGIFPNGAKLFENSSFELNSLNGLSDSFYKSCNVKNITRAPESGLDMHSRRVMRTVHCVLRELGLCKKKTKTPFLEPLYLANDSAKLRLEFTCKDCGMNVFYEK